jgi:hypothetical protein
LLDTTYRHHSLLTIKIDSRLLRRGYVRFTLLCNSSENYQRCTLCCGSTLLRKRTDNAPPIVAAMTTEDDLASNYSQELHPGITRHNLSLRYLAELEEISKRKIDLAELE